MNGVMTLHWWMHWFWITCQVSYCYCATTLLPMHSVGSELHEGVTIHNVTGSTTNVSSLKNVTSGPYITTAIPIKLRKPIKKHETILTTVRPIIKASTVINEGNTSLFVTENQTSVNISYDAINHVDNFSFIEDTNDTNQNLLVNSERFGDTRENLTAAGITGITLGCVIIIGIICAVSFILYRNYGLNRPQVLNDHCSNPDSSGYIDDSSVRENSEEMYSLDNDSFLNSLEAMTIQNLWTDTVKHTKL